MHERRRHSGIDAARESADDQSVRAGVGGMAVDTLADACDGLLDEVGSRPGGLDAGDALDEVAQDVLAARGVNDLGMELDAVEVSVGRGQTRIGGRIGLRGRVEAIRQPGDRIAVAHPDRLLTVDVGEEAVMLRDRHARGAIFATLCREDVATELERHHLRAVADPEHRDASAPDGRIGARGFRVVDRHRPAREDDRPGPPALELGNRRVVRQQLGVHVELADAAGDQLRELAAEVEDGDGPTGLALRAGGAIVSGSLRGRRLQRGLEVGLDLGIVRREDPVAGVRWFAVDRLASAGAVGCGVSFGFAGLVLATLRLAHRAISSSSLWRQCTRQGGARSVAGGPELPPAARSWRPAVSVSARGQADA